MSHNSDVKRGTILGRIDSGDLTPTNLTPSTSGGGRVAANFGYPPGQRRLALTRPLPRCCGPGCRGSGVHEQVHLSGFLGMVTVQRRLGGSPERGRAHINVSAVSDLGQVREDHVETFARGHRSAPATPRHATSANTVCPNVAARCLSPTPAQNPLRGPAATAAATGPRAPHNAGAVHRRCCLSYPVDMFSAHPRIGAVRQKGS